MGSRWLAKAERLREGALDLHVHLAPDAVPRVQDALEMALDCRGAGLAGFLLKDHLTVTADRAALVERAVPGVRVFGAVTLNHAVGGLNPDAVSAALALGARLVCMPTFCAGQDIDGSKTARGAYGRFVPPLGPPGLRILRADGSLQPAVEEILERLRGSEAILGTGHLSPGESLALVARARDLGLRRVVVTHASSPVVAMTVAQQRRAVELGALIEHCYLPFLRGADLATLVGHIRAVGASHCLLSTDLGQQGNPPPVAGLTRFVADLLALGVGEDEIRRMVHGNPRVLAGLD